MGRMSHPPRAGGTRVWSDKTKEAEAANGGELRIAAGVKCNGRARAMTRCFSPSFLLTTRDASRLPERGVVPVLFFHRFA
jgi:hypothetical protein